MSSVAWSCSARSPFSSCTMVSIQNSSLNGWSLGPTLVSFFSRSSFVVQICSTSSLFFSLCDSSLSQLNIALLSSLSRATFVIRSPIDSIWRHWASSPAFNSLNFPSLFRTSSYASTSWMSSMSCSTLSASFTVLEDETRSTQSRPLTFRIATTAPRQAEARPRGPDEREDIIDQRALSRPWRRPLCSEIDRKRIVIRRSPCSS